MPFVSECAAFALLCTAYARTVFVFTLRGAGKPRHAMLTLAEVLVSVFIAVVPRLQGDTPAAVRYDWERVNSEAATE